MPRHKLLLMLCCKRCQGRLQVRLHENTYLLFHGHQELTDAKAASVFHSTGPSDTGMTDPGSANVTFSRILMEFSCSYPNQDVSTHLHKSTFARIAESRWGLEEDRKPCKVTGNKQPADSQMTQVKVSGSFVAG